MSVSLFANSANRRPWKIVGESKPSARNFPRFGKAAWDLLQLSETERIRKTGYSFFDFLNALRLAGVGLLVLALWLLRYDLVWQSARQAGLPRFMAICLIAGYVWLAAGGFLWIGFAQFFSAGPRYDAMLHTIFLGFVFSMIFAHAPIILPTITGLALPFQNAFYLHLGLLHLSLVVTRLGGSRTGALAATVRWIVQHAVGAFVSDQQCSSG
jgi:hypothetical protein